jgi:hypothetical protein
VVLAYELRACDAELYTLSYLLFRVLLFNPTHQSLSFDLS